MRLAVWLGLLVLAASAADAEARPRLRAFRSCADLVAFARRGAERTGGGVGVVPRAAPPGGEAIVRPRLVPPGAKAPAAPVPTAGGDGGTAFSGTNVQEAGVDEPDVVKTDGERVFAVTDGTLRVIDVSHGAPELVGTLKLAGYDQRLLIRGDRVLAIASQGVSTVLPVRGVPVPAIGLEGPGAATTIVTEIRVADDGSPSVLRTMTVPGRFVDARQHGGTARLVIDAAPAPIAVPARARLGRFLGRTVLRSRLTGRTYRRPLAPCDRIRRPRAFSGLDVLAILTVDLDRGMYSLDRDGVMAGAQVVYGSPDSLCVASRRYRRALELGAAPADGARTEIHRFDISDPDRTVYRASGSVPGFVLNSYALSQYKGDLRVATTEEAPWLPGGESSSRLTVLRQDGAALSPVGSVGGLGKGQRIFAVRFLGDKAFVVTFRQVDPLYALDLSDPRAPRVRGALELPGYSAYLHPITDDLLLGVGREGADLQASLFDVSDLAAPRRVSRLAFSGGGSAAESDPHAFLYWAPAQLAVLPLETFGEAGPAFDGAVGLHAAAGDPLREVGRVSHDDERLSAPIERSLVVGDRVYTLSYLGLAASRLDTLQSVGFLRFPAA